MERIMTHVGGSSGGSVVSREEEEEQQSSNSNMGVCSDEVCSYPDEADLQLGLGLSLSVGNKYQGPRILTAQDLPCMGLRALKPSSPSASSSSSSCLGGGDGGGGVDGGNYHGSWASGTKRPADTSPTGVSQVMGWPPVRAYRVNSLANQAKTVTAGEAHPNKGDGVICSAEDKGKANHNDSEHLRGSLFVKVNMDGLGIGRKVDLNAHSSYDSLAQTLEEMFTLPTRSDRTDTFTSNRGECGGIQKAKRSSRLLDGLSDFVLTYEDKDRDWMLVGDVPWGLFLNSVKRLRIMKRSEANGLESRFEERICKPRSDPCTQRSRLT